MSVYNQSVLVGGPTEMALSNDKDTPWHIAASLRMLNVFRQLRPTMPLQYAYAFLLVAETEGLTVSDYAGLAKVSQTVMTRHLMDIGQQTRNREPGLGLVMQRQDPLDMRKHQTFLTPAGKGLLLEIKRALRRDSE